jgi:hypothetical protein
MGRVVVLMTACALLAAAGAPAASDSGAVTWRTLAASTGGALPAGQLLPASSFAGVAPGAAGALGWRVVVFSSAREVTRALPGLAAQVRAAVGRARAATNFGYRRLVLIAVATRAGCCPFAIAELTSTGATVELTVRQVPCGTCPATGAGIQVLLVSVPRTTFPLPVRLGVGVQPPPTCPAGYSYAGFVSAPAANLTATLTMGRLPALVTPMDHALAYASIVARDAHEVPRAWLQAGIGRGAIGTYADDGRAWIYVEAETAGGYQLTEIAPATAGVPVTVSFVGSGSSWTVDIDGKEAYAADLGLPATGTSTAVEVYRATGGGACPSLEFSLAGVVPKGAQRGDLPLVDETSDGWRVRLG